MKVGELLADASRWCKGNSACNSRGIPTTWDSSEAHSFCLYGAIGRCYGPIMYGHTIIVKLKEAVDNLYPEYNGYISAFNDSDITTHEDILRVLELADI